MWHVHMRRRTSISILGGAVALPLAARRQQPQIPVVGFLGTASPASLASFVAGVLQGLKEVRLHRWPERCGAGGRRWHTANSTCAAEFGGYCEADMPDFALARPGRE